MSFELDWDENALGVMTDEAIEAGLENGAGLLRYLSEQRTPRRTGDLIDSAGVDVDGDEASVYYSKFYAAWVHEKLDHAHPRGGQAKFLEAAVNEDSDMVFDAIAIGMKRAIG